MVPEEIARTPESFTTFGELLRYLRRRAALRQHDVAAAARLSPRDVSRLEQNLAMPDSALVEHTLVPALGIQHQPEWAARLLALANEHSIAGVAPAVPSQRTQLTPTNPAAELDLAEAWSDPQQVITKFHIPQAHGRSVVRERLLAQLDAALAVPLTLVAAPPGSGKTTLLADWVERWRLGTRDWRLAETDLASSLQPPATKVAWLALDGDDNDPATFVRYLVGALRHLAPGIGSATLALLQPALPPARMLLAPLVNQLATHPSEAVLVLDDWHLITSRAVNQLLGWLLEHLPPRLHLVIASRTDPPLPLAQLRARGQLAELRGADLRFQGAEAHDLLRHAAGSEVTADHAEALEARTEGWAAGLQLAGLALRDRRDREAFIAAFTGSHRYLADYLTSEVLDRLPMYVRSFVMQTAILDRMCAPLCDAVVEIDAQAFIAEGDPPAQLGAHPAELDAQRMLEALERMQLFVVPLDDERRWYRYHHLFAEVVRAQLQQAFGAAAVARLHQRASDWYDRANLVDDALDHALAAGAPVRAAALVEHRAAGLIESGVLLPLWRWLRRLPNGVVHTRPALALAGAMVAIAAGDLERAGALLSRVDQAHDDERATLEATQPASWLGYTAATAQLLHASLARARGEAERARMLVGQALAALPSEQPFLRAWALWEQGSAELLAGDAQSARRSFEMLLDDGLPRYGGLAIQAAIGLARIATLQGRLRDTSQLYERAIGAGRGEESSASRAVGLLHAGLASVHYERNELGAAEQQVQAALALGGDPPSALLTAVANVALARIKRAQGEVAAASQALAQAQEMLPALQSPFFRDLLAGYGYGQLCLDLGDITAVAALVGDATVNSETRRYLQARLLVRQGQLGAALELLTELCAEAKATARNGSLIELSILQAVARHGRDEQKRALTALEQALRLAEPEGYVRVFVDAGPPIANLLRAAEVRGSVPEYVAKLLAASERLEARDWRTDDAAPAASLQLLASTLVEPLTGRELEVLRLIAAGHSNRVIARMLVIELGTVKRHVHSLLGKLGAQSRTQAVAHARAYGLL